MWVTRAPKHSLRDTAIRGLTELNNRCCLQNTFPSAPATSTRAHWSVLRSITCCIDSAFPVSVRPLMDMLERAFLYGNT